MMRYLTIQQQIDQWWQAHQSEDKPEVDPIVDFRKLSHWKVNERGELVE